MKFALISGIGGQDGSYLAELLLSKDYIVYGMIRRCSLFNLSRLTNIRSNPNLKLIYGDITDSSNLIGNISKIKEKLGDNILEVYNLAAQSHVGISFEMPEYTAQVTGFGTLNFLECLRNSGIPLSQIRFYQASSSEMFGGEIGTAPQNETTPFKPKSPYSTAKLYAHNITQNYRESYNMFACAGILFNHSSDRRGENFILRKLSLGVSKWLKNGEPISLGNLYSKRDIAHAKDMVYGMWLLLQQPTPKDYVLATGKQYSIKEFVEMAFKIVGVKVGWKGNGLQEEGYDLESGSTVVKINPKNFRPNEVETLLGDYSLAEKELGWKPTIGIEELIKEMIENDTQQN